MEMVGNLLGFDLVWFLMCYNYHFDGFFNLFETLIDLINCVQLFNFLHSLVLKCDGKRSGFKGENIE
jgi:hypothetical protein